MSNSYVLKNFTDLFGRVLRGTSPDTATGKELDE